MGARNLTGRLLVQDLDEKGTTLLRPLEKHLIYPDVDDLRTAIKAVCAERLDQGSRRFVLDLSRVNIMDSAAVVLLLSVRRLLGEHAARVVLAGPRATIRKLLRATSLDRVFEVEPDVDRAMAVMA